MEVKSLVEGLFDDLYNARIDKFIDRLDKDIYLSLPRNPANAVIPFTGDWRGHEAVLEFLDLRARTTESENKILSISVSGQSAFVNIRADGICKVSNQRFVIEDIHRITFDTYNKVSSWHIYADLGALTDAFNAALPMQLVKAVDDNNVKELKSLISLGANVNIRSKETGLTLLMMAACERKYEIVRILVDSGADVFTTDSYTGATALHKACQGGDPRIGQYLIKAGAFVDAVTPTMGHTPIMDALWYKSVEMVEELLKYEPNIETTTHYGFTLWDHLKYEASSQGTEEGEKIFNEISKQLKGYKDLSTTRIEENTLLSLINEGDTNGVEQLLNKSTTNLEERFPHVNSFSDGHTPLLIACRDNHFDIVKILLEAGAEVDSFDWIFKGYTIHKATYNGRADILKELLLSPKMNERIVNVQGKINGYSPLHDALWHGFEDCALILLEDARCKLGLKGHDGKDELTICKEVFGTDHKLYGLIKSKLSEQGGSLD
jgi:uncharacterized protein